MMKSAHTGPHSHPNPLIRGALSVFSSNANDRELLMHGLGWAREYRELSELNPGYISCWAEVLRIWTEPNLGGAIQFSLCIIFETESWNLVWNHWIRITIMISKILILALFSLHLGRANAVKLRNDLPVCQCSDFTFLNFKNERVSLSNVSLYTL